MRAADTDFLSAVTRGEFCYVLTPRQMGKTSLMARTVAALQGHTATVVIDLTQIGAQLSADEWYFGLARSISRQLRLSIDLPGLWKQSEGAPPLQRLMEFFEDAVLPGCDQKVVIFLDEIDSTLNLEFSDDFFAAVRSCYNQRALNPEWDRLTFVLLGSASPADLMKDRSRTPFNIGRRIELTDFSLGEARVLAGALHGDNKAREGLLKRSLYWTGGQPYLTQKLCLDMASDESCTSTEQVDELAKTWLGQGHARRTESNFAFISERSFIDPKIKSQALEIYEQLLSDNEIEDDPRSPAHATLRISGIVRTRPDGKLRVANRLYENVFNLEWVRVTQRSDLDRVTAAEAEVYSSTLVSIRTDVRVAEETYTQLRAITGYEDRADELLARFWDKNISEQGGSDGRFLAGAKAQGVRQSLLRTHRMGRYAVSSWRSLVMTFRHEGSVNTVAVSADGTKVVTGSDDNTARVWDTSTGEALTPALSHESLVWSVALSADGTKVVTGSWDNTARVWDTSTGEALTPALSHESVVVSVALSADGTKVVTGSGDNTARVWDTSTGEALTPALSHEGFVWSVALSADGTKVVTGSWDNTARVWDTSTGEALTPALSHEGRVWSVALSADGTKVVTGSDDNTARVWDTSTGEALTPALSHEGLVRSVALSADGTKVVTGSDDNTVRVWDATTGQLMGSPIHVIDSIRALTFSPDGRSLHIASDWWVIIFQAGEEAGNDWLDDVSESAGQLTDRDGEQMDGGRAEHYRLGKVVATRSYIFRREPPARLVTQELIEQWSRRLSLKLDNNGIFVPRYPAAVKPAGF